MNTRESYLSTESNESYVGFRVWPASLLLAVLVSGLLVGGVIIGSNLRSSTYRASLLPIVGVPSPESWTIEGALTEACTCSVPCTCNFGEGPSPHDYCYALYSYEIRKGKYGEVTLDGLHFGASDLKNGRTIFIDERASELQREALRVIAARVILRTAPDKAESKAKELVKDARYVAVKQEYDNRRNKLDVKGIGEFSADYIMGLDKTEPVVVRNNTTWRIRDAIKAKTTIFRVKIGKDSVNTRNTNSNQGDFEYTDKMDYGKQVEWSCGMGSRAMTQNATGEVMCGM